MNNRIIYVVQEIDYSQEQVVYAGFDMYRAYDENKYDRQFSTLVSEWENEKCVKKCLYNPYKEKWDILFNLRIEGE